MTDQEINIAIAKACGWQIVAETHQDGITHRVRVVKPFPGPVQDLPNYANDLNAMHEAGELLWRECEAEKKWGAFNRYCLILETSDSWASRYNLVRALARQRAEAFLRVKGLWKD